ncbi:hypothetical protein [Microbulbifer sp. HZ11]|uniref:hypothetical protein n=1 Tax=Microbulbifer sp. HZ11 TaxID=1453501 RepID=UPI0005B778F6|nr:hypothetical protein [Microbulbifer sp. HZ11]
MSTQNRVISEIEQHWQEQEQFWVKRARRAERQGNAEAEMEYRLLAVKAAFNRRHAAKHIRERWGRPLGATQ